MRRRAREHKYVVQKSKTRRATRRRIAQWRWDHGYWGPDAYAVYNKWIWNKTIGALLARGKSVLAQDSIMPRLTFTAEQARVHRVHDDVVLTPEQIEESRRRLHETPIKLTVNTPGQAVPVDIPVGKNWSVVTAMADKDSE